MRAIMILPRLRSDMLPLDFGRRALALGIGSTALSAKRKKTASFLIVSVLVM
jgi:hypothetical protein